MNPNTGTFISMDTYQGNMYEPVTLHKYLYANANPVKYTDPSGNMSFSLTDISAAQSIAAMWREKQTTIIGMGLMNALANTTMTALAGGDWKEIAGAAAVGFLQGAGMAMLACAIAAITATSLATAFGFLVSIESVTHIMIAMICINDGNYSEALIHIVLAVLGLIYQLIRMEPISRLIIIMLLILVHYKFRMMRL